MKTQRPSPSIRLQLSPGACSILLLWVLTSGCMIHQRGLSSRLSSESHCDTDSSGVYGYAFHPVELKPDSPQDTLLRHRFTDRGLRIAQATGLTPYLLALIAQERKPFQDQTATEAQAYGQLRQAISDHIQLANFDVASTAAELDCRARQATQTAEQLTRRENARVKRLTIFSITVGALAVVGGSLLQLSHQDGFGEGIDIAGGVAGAGLGLSAFWVAPFKTNYHTPITLCEQCGYSTPHRRGSPPP